MEWTRYFYKHPEDDAPFVICKDQDGYLVTKPDGGNDAHGTGYSLNEVEEMYGLNNYHDTKSGAGSCNDAG